MTIHSVYGPDGNRIAEYNEATGALIRQYIWLQGAPIAVVEGGVVSFVRSDHIGRPVFATDSTGVKVWTAAYLPFGGVRVTTGTPPTARFPGQWFQSETGLHQNWMRDYDPTTGRYMQADPFRLVDGASVYGYAGQNPGRYVDPTGQCFGPAAALMGACIAGGLFIGGMILDYLSNDCYTYMDFAYSALSNWPGARAFRGLGALGRGLGWGNRGPSTSSFGPGGGGGNGPGPGGGGGGGGNGPGAGPGGGGGDYHPSTPTGSRGNELGVPPGTNSPETIDGRYYTGHALDRMQGRGYTPTVVENVIGSGVPSPGNTPGTTQYYDVTNNISAIVNDAGGVVTVRGGP